MERTKSSDYFISIHRNAFKPEYATDTEVFLYSLTKSLAKPMASNIQKALVQVGFRNRGVKQADLYVLKHTQVPALFLELGFIDNSTFNELILGITNVILAHLQPGTTTTCSSCRQVIV